MIAIKSKDEESFTEANKLLINYELSQVESYCFDLHFPVRNRDAPTMRCKLDR